MYDKRITFDAMTNEEFLNRIEKTESGCWNWTGAINGNGYGSVRIGKAMWRTHRLSYILRKGPIPDGLLVCHKCDNRKCLNPDHLFLGSTADNNWDKSHKGRCPRGSTHRFSHLQDYQVPIIRDAIKAGFTDEQICGYFRVRSHVITHIRYNQTYKHVKSN